MNVFELRDRLVHDYGSFVESFIRIRDTRIRDVVATKLEEGHLWPSPLIQLNPAFKSGAFVEALVSEGILHPSCSQIFRRGKDQEEPEGMPLRLHQHQEDAIRIASQGHDYVLTTGTGSGKSLAYIIPIVDRILRGSPGGGVKAIIVYPMNALANSQQGELEKFLGFGVGSDASKVRFAKYTGQEGREERDEILKDPPDIILTNYVMLELMLSRPEERQLITAAEGLQFLVLDELHTYRGRQGADVAYLVRRVRERMGSSELQCVGTSATIAGAGTYSEQRAEVAEVAGKLFGTAVDPENVIGETLRRATPERPLDDESFVEDLRQRVRAPGARPLADHQGYVTDPLSSWLETTVGIRREGGSSSRLIRAVPRPLTGPEGLARELGTLTGEPEGDCLAAIQEHLMAGYRAEGDPETGFPPFAFRLHQFVSRGDTVYATPELEERRDISLEGQRFVPEDRSRGYLPLVFCRECGQEYYCVKRTHGQDSDRTVFQPRDLGERTVEEGEFAGFLYISQSRPWPRDPEAVTDRVPEDWLEGDRVRRDWRDRLPHPTAVNGLGEVGEGGTPVHFFPAPFRFCLSCGVAYSHHQRGDFGKLGSLATEGRSTSTTVMALSAVRYLKGSDLPDRAQKLLSFSDNRQDASLQAGHLNDFVEVGLLRAATYRAALDAGPEGLAHEELTQQVFSALNLPFAAYASNPDAVHAARRRTERALRDVLGYRLYRDLKRGWRITLPNLEQCGLLEIRYPDLKDICEDETLWQGTHGGLVGASPDERRQVCQTLLDFLRRELAIKVDFLNEIRLEQIQQSSNVQLKEPWALDDQENLISAAIAFPRSKKRGDYQGNVFLSPRGGFGTYLRRPGTLSALDERPNLTEAEAIIRDLMRVLGIGGLLEEVEHGGDVESDQEAPPGYQLVASAMRWCPGEGERSFHDPIRVPREPEEGVKPNPFFRDFYRSTALELLGIEAKEHTAQVQYAQRERREERFRNAELPILFCSPTMELGVDIAELNVVSLRNMPPTPANYAQRSGRAGRSGKPALVFTYCSTYSAHDQYFFRRPNDMVQGAVLPPRLDLANEDLVRAHVQAVWLSEAGCSLGTSLKEIIEIEGEAPTLELRPSIRGALEDEGARRRAERRVATILSSVAEDLEGAGWYTPSWTGEVLSRVPLAFEDACGRWKELYHAAWEQYQRQSKIRVDHARPEKDRREAERLQREAASQIDLLTDARHALQSDFYSYRYFAAEGFLPGYAFPRLPLSAFIPGRRTRSDDREFVSRPRFLAISEFGPRAFVYHEGARYQINRVILPVDEEEDPTTARMKQCPECGYAHPIEDGDGVDLCENCGNSLGAPMRNLLRLHNVATRRRDRISADEEERTRYGYEIRTGIRFGKAGVRSAELSTNGELRAHVRYGHPVRIYRINLGWNRRDRDQPPGFVLDVERGYWASNKAMEEDDPEDPMSNRHLRVIPFVDDWKNALVLEPGRSVSEEAMASLQAALKNAIQVAFQLEEQELAAESLPDRFNRRLLLFYEAAEGGAGVLRRLVEEPDAFREVAREALRLCHFDPETGNDLGKAPHARERCEAACYDCLMSYQNQLDHELLDRHAILGELQALAQAELKASPGQKSRSQHLADLRKQCDTNLERRWLAALDAKDLALPDDAQHRIESCGTRSDFFYRRQKVVVYVDGPAHDFPDRQERDAAKTECLEDLGYLVVRFHHEDEWGAKFDRFSALFGGGGR